TRSSGHAERLVAGDGAEGQAHGVWRAVAEEAHATVEQQQVHAARVPAAVTPGGVARREAGVARRLRGGVERRGRAARSGLPVIFGPRAAERPGAVLLSLAVLVLRIERGIGNQADALAAGDGVAAAVGDVREPGHRVLQEGAIAAVRSTGVETPALESG